MDLEKAIRHDEMDRMLRQFTRSAQAMGASPAEVIGALMGMSAMIYSIEVSGAVGEREQKAAKQLYVRGTAAVLSSLPTQDRDDRTEAELKKRGL